MRVRVGFCMGLMVSMRDFWGESSCGAGDGSAAAVALTLGLAWRAARPPRTVRYRTLTPA